jgi:hypothetical protein
MEVSDGLRQRTCPGAGQDQRELASVLCLLWRPGQPQRASESQLPDPRLQPGLV